MTEGDRHSKYYHNLVTIHRRANHIYLTKTDLDTVPDQHQTVIVFPHIIIVAIETIC